MLKPHFIRNFANTNGIMLVVGWVTVPQLFLLIILQHLSVFWHRDTLLPVLNDAHHGSFYAHIESLGNLHKEVFLNLESSFPDTPAAIHEERNINFTIYRDGWESNESHESKRVLVYYYQCQFWRNVLGSPCVRSLISGALAVESSPRVLGNPRKSEDVAITHQPCTLSIVLWRTKCMTILSSPNLKSNSLPT